MNKLKKMALQVIVESLSKEEIAGLKEMFKAMDTDNSGAITFDELKDGLQRYGSMMKDTEIRNLMDAADVDNAFQYFDKDGSGYITVDELQQACAEHNMTDASLKISSKKYFDKDNEISAQKELRCAK
ncbi:hypothetical protein NL676_038263 [Syzygium grande]|nr:hypothetical protein NL676_038263 [Syzygium grande]